MFDPPLKSTGREYTTTIALLAVAFIFIPAVVVAERLFGYLSLSLALAGSALCVTLAWVHWKRSSQLTMPSIAIRDAGAK